MELKTQRLKLNELSLGCVGNIHLLHSLPQTDAFYTLGISATLQITLGGHY